jgi:DNA-binding HxlR family transcriptional regulator
VAHQTVGLLETCSGPEAVPGRGCPVEVTIETLRGRWTPLIIGEFRHGERTYSELRDGLPALSDKVLSDRLHQLTEAGVLDRHRTAAWPPRVTYSLTDRGRELVPVLQALWEWGARA